MSWGEGWVLSCVSAACSLPGQECGRKVVFLLQAEGADLFSCLNCTTWCAAHFGKCYPRLEILTAVTCWCAQCSLQQQLCHCLLVTKVPEEGMGCFPCEDPWILCCSLLQHCWQLSWVPVLVCCRRASTIQGKLWVVSSSILIKCFLRQSVSFFFLSHFLSWSKAAGA